MGLMRCTLRLCGRRRRLGTLAFVLLTCVVFWMVTGSIHLNSVGDPLKQRKHNVEYDYLTHHERARETDAGPLLHANGRLPKEVVEIDSENNDHNEQQPPRQMQQTLATSMKDGARKSPVNVDDNKQYNQTNAENITAAAPVVHNEAIPRLPPPSQIGPDSLELLHQLILKLNTEQRVINADKFPPLSPDGLVLLVQVHHREGYLKQLMESLKQAKEIENVLLVISHDYFYDEMNDLVQSIDFCRVVQVFYPHSLQLFPTSFPGQSKGDCPRDATKEQALASNCTNANHPDSFGHYREAQVTAIKHHWWWKINMVFDRIRETQNFSGYVLFLEEDHYVSPDFIVMFKKLRELRNEDHCTSGDSASELSLCYKQASKSSYKKKCAECDFLNMGMYTNVKNYAGLSQRASIGIWNAGKNNMGFGMDRKTWNTVKSCAEHFCKYDDYNWDWSLNLLGTSCLQRQLKVMVLKAPRIFHIGTCGIHHKKSCNEKEEADKIKRKIGAQKQHLFPETLHLDGGLSPGAPRKKVKNYGGWGDIRDHELCLSFVDR